MAKKSQTEGYIDAIRGEQPATPEAEALEGLLDKQDFKYAVGDMDRHWRCKYCGADEYDSGRLYQAMEHEKGCVIEAALRAAGRDG